MNKPKYINVINFLFVLKFLFCFYISYLILFQGDVGKFIYTIGSLFVAGNSILGILILISAIIINYFIVTNIVNGINTLLKFKNILFLFDTILVLFTLILNIFISINVNNIYITDALIKYIILACGSYVIYVLTTIVLLLILKFVTRNDKQCTLDSVINNNPLNFNGRINRLSYFIVQTFVFVIFCIIKLYHFNFISEYSEVCFILQVFLLITLFFISLFSTSKRLRDINWNQCLLLITCIPIIGSIIVIPLFFIRSKY